MFINTYGIPASSQLGAQPALKEAAINNGRKVSIARTLLRPAIALTYIVALVSIQQMVNEKIDSIYKSRGARFFIKPVIFINIAGLSSALLVSQNLLTKTQANIAITIAIILLLISKAPEEALAHNEVAKPPEPPKAPATTFKPLYKAGSPAITVAVIKKASVDVVAPPGGPVVG